MPADKRITEFSVPTSEAFGLVAGPDGHLWYTDGSSSRTEPGTYHDVIARMAMDGSVEQFHTPTPSSGPGWMIVGPDHALWFDEVTGAIGRITMSGAITEFGVGWITAPGPLVVGADGAIWFLEQAQTPKLGRMTTAGDLSEFPIPWVNQEYPSPKDLVSGNDGNLWFTEAAGMIGRATLTGQFTSFPASNRPSLALQGLTVGPDGALWFPESWRTEVQEVPGTYVMHRVLGRMTYDGSTSDITLPDDDAAPSLITTGPDGNLWMTEWYKNKVIRVTPSGRLTELTATAPLDIAAGPDGNVWFTENGRNIVGRVNLSELPG